MALERLTKLQLLYIRKYNKKIIPLLTVIVQIQSRMFPFKTRIGRYQWRKRFYIRLPLDSPSARLGKFRHVCQPFLIACDLHFLNYPTPDDLSSPILFTSNFSNEKQKIIMNFPVLKVMVPKNLIRSVTAQQHYYVYQVP